MLDKCTTISGTCHLQFPCGAHSTARHPHADLSSSFATCHQMLSPGCWQSQSRLSAKWVQPAGKVSPGHRQSQSMLAESVRQYPSGSNRRVCRESLIRGHFCTSEGIAIIKLLMGMNVLSRRKWENNICFRWIPKWSHFYSVETVPIWVNRFDSC